jgi:hydrogenase maturation protein HypF
VGQHKECLTITIQGIVQGVGFRPFIYNLARQLGIHGFVSNTSEGVIIHAEGTDLDLFIDRIRREAPPLSRIEKVEIAPSDPTGLADFFIRASRDAGSFTLLSPDIAVCDACLQELFTAGDRRYRYPFINCTNCGPRFSITRSVPYDRKNTTMQVFTLCDACSAEYHDPGNRRFHAQPNACSVCGPKVTLLDAQGKMVDCSDAIARAVGLMKQGKIVAIKGLGGFHIACDAMNHAAITLLRQRKRRSNKPFAIMSPDLSFIKECCKVTPEEELLMTSPQRPVVLLRKNDNCMLPDAVAPGNACLGFMLPYTPLHYLLFVSADRTAMESDFRALVMTSGNLSEEPIIGTNEEAVQKLSPIVDAFLVHDRDIFMRVDDSVLRVMSRLVSGSKHDVAAATFIRRSRGFAPEPVPLPDDGPIVLGCGADVKNTFALTRGRYAILSQHIGDMENYETRKFFEETLRNLTSVYRAQPELVVYDLHPRYLSSSWALEYAVKKGLSPVGLQHHYAHIGSVMAEHGLKDRVIGVAFDGTGYGSDGTLWGGEFLIADTHGFVRAGHLKQVPLPGGEMAVREPWRTAVSYLKDAYGADEIIRNIGPTGFLEKYGRKGMENILMLADNRDFSPLSSGAGRLFDAAAAIMGVSDRNTFEGEASMALESLAADGIDDAYPVDIHFGTTIEVDFSYTILALVDDLRRSVGKRHMAAKFHNAVVDAITRVVLKLAVMNNIKMIALSGGVFQNHYLTERVRNKLLMENLAVYANEHVPCNDAGISLGQAYLAREMMKDGALS